MSGVPVLSAGEIRQRLAEIYRHGHRKLVALYGTGEDGRVDVPGVGTFDVCPVKSELDLRKALPDRIDEQTRMAFLVPWRGTLPLDLGASFAQDGFVFALGTELRLKRLVEGATELEDAVRDSELAKYLLEHPARALAFAGGRLTLDALWNAWLATWGVPSDAVASFEGLLAFAAMNDAGPRYRASVPESVRGEWAALLARRFDPVGRAARVAWDAWERGEERAKPLELGLVFEALQGASGEARMWGLLQAKGLGVADQEREPLLEALARAAAAALRIVEARSEKTAAQLLASADARVDEAVVRAALGSSRWLPSAWGRRLDALGAVLAEGAANPTRAALERAIAARAELELHRSSKHPEQSATVDRAEMAVRLLAWLVARTDQPARRGASVYADVEDLARWYAAEGGFVDWARRRARGSDNGAFGRGANVIARAADTVRRELDRAFARALPAWLESGKPRTSVLPIEAALEHFGARFLAERDERRLLVLLMDGMGWAQAAEILSSLKSWGPVAWNLASGKVGSASSLVPVLAALPSVTDVSRAAFFAGTAMKPGRLDPTDRDVDRFARFAKLRPFARDGVPRLMLRGEGHTLDGSASVEALNLVADTDQRVVAIVINAIDSYLKSDTQQRTTWTADEIKPLQALLEAAQDAGRTVLLAADHGHVPCDRMESVGSPPDAKARWRVWKEPDEPIAEYEVALTKKQAWAPANAHGVVLLSDDEHRYGAAPHAGEHGGATLAEVVAPAILIGSDRLAAFTGDDDAELRVVGGFAAPPWWYPTVERAKPVRRETPKPMKAPQQLALLEPSPPAARTTASTGLHPLAAMLQTSKVFASLGIDEPRRQQLTKAIDFLARRGGERAKLEAFADAVGILHGRAGGLVATLSSLISVDSFSPLTYDPSTNEVELDGATLRHLFGEP